MKNLFFLLMFTFVLGLYAQEYTGDEIRQPDRVIKCYASDTIGSGGILVSKYTNGDTMIFKGYQASPKSDTGLVIEYNPFHAPDSEWVTGAAPPGIWIGQIFRKIRVLNTTVKIDSIRKALR
jgi:hypothetical protein